ncbi:hypothetical protein [Aporhodopirellula aestuarii]|uniref:Uncharacterized protein n=2 Tax=Aporhodopirellula aestuarii TaxID=2950107 RepID=A0ABT0U847_9BACT|nr:hypothetical protein [Aporhodopirellula aestuarii]MCM2373087.1 hypothetical protein [Aporhodopirellula aestuarii]
MDSSNGGKQGGSFNFYQLGTNIAKICDAAGGVWCIIPFRPPWILTMRTSLMAPTKTGTVIGSSASLPEGNPSEPVPVPLASSPSAPSLLDEEIAHMGRRLFRTLEHPDRCPIAIDCGTVSMEQIKELTDQFFNDEAFRDCHNLVLAIPTDGSFEKSPSYEYVQSIKEFSFENHFDGKVSWLLIHQPETELNALAKLAQQRGGQWYGA